MARNLETRGASWRPQASGPATRSLRRAHADMAATVWDQRCRRRRLIELEEIKKTALDTTPPGGLAQDRERRQANVR